MALSTFPTHPEKILPRLDHLLEIANMDDQGDAVYIIQLLHLVVKKNPEVNNRLDRRNILHE